VPVAEFLGHPRRGLADNLHQPNERQVELPVAIEIVPASASRHLEGFAPMVEHVPHARQRIPALV